MSNILLRILNKLGVRQKNSIFYIGGSDSLPAPLSPEEEAKLLARLSPEEEDVKKVLIERNLRLVVYVARKFENTGINIEDLISIGSIGLIKAINTFDTGKNIKLATIENEILMYLRKNHNQKSEISIDEPLNTDWDGNELLLSDILGTDADEISKRLDEETDRQLLHLALEHLSQREKQIMELRFGLENGNEKTQRKLPTFWVSLNPIFPAWKSGLCKG